MNKSLLYIRVSSKEQEAEGFSLDAQEKLGEDYARRNNLSIVKRWKVSESAWKEERSAFGEMIEYTKKHDEVKNIIFDITDRMTRNDMDKIKILTLVKYHDKTIHFSRSNKILNKESGSEDVFMLDIEVAVAKKMSNDISRKTKMGMLEKAEQGLYPSNAPLGYINNRIAGTIEIDEKHSPYIKKAFELIASSDYSLQMVSNTLYEEGFRGKKDNKVMISALHHILRNPIYYGAFRWNNKLYPGKHTPIISKELFDTVQSVLSGKGRPCISKKEFYFNNLITCGTCNCKVIGEAKKKNKYIYYHCTFSKGRHNGAGYIRDSKLVQMFEKPVLGASIPENMAQWLKQGLKELNKDSIAYQEKQNNRLNKEKTKINNRLSRLFDMRIDREIDDLTFKSKEQEYKTQLAEIENQLSNKKTFNENYYEDGCKILEISKSLPKLYDEGNHEEKANILRYLASNYTLNDVSLIPTYRKPFNLLAKGLSRTIWLPREDSNLGQAG